MGKQAYDCIDLIELFMNDAELIGFLIGDGCVNQGIVTLFTGSFPETIWLENKVKHLGVHYWKGRHGCFGHRLIISRKGLSARLLAEGCGGPSHEKRIPSFIMNGTREAKCAFLRGLFQADGWITSRGSGRCEICFVSVSLVLVEDVTKLLSEEGIIVTLSSRPPSGYGVRDSYRVSLRGLLSRLRYFHKIGFSFGDKLSCALTWNQHYKKLIEGGGKDIGFRLKRSKGLLEKEYGLFVAESVV